MKRIKRSKTLVVHSETVRQLATTELAQVGGGESDDTKAAVCVSFATPPAIPPLKG